MMGRQSATERELAELAARGMDGDALIAIVENPEVAGDDIPVISAYDEDHATVPFELGMLADVPNLRDPFARVLAQRATELTLASMVNERWRLSWFTAFVTERNPALALRDIDNALLDDFRDRLDDHVTRKPTGGKDKHKRPHVFHEKGGKKLAVGTKILIMETVLAILRRLRAGKRFSSQISRDLDLVRGHNWKTPGRRTPTAVLTRPQLKLLVRICREEVAEITARLNAARVVIDGGTDGPADEALVDAELVREAVRLDRLFGGHPPIRAKFKWSESLNRSTFPRLYACNSERYNAVMALLYPTGRLMMPFALLFAIYYRYNPSVLTKLEFGNFSEQPAARGKRLVGSPFKARSGRTQVASWPVTADAHNPAQMRVTLEAWTKAARDRAPRGQENHMFLTRYSGGKIRSLDNRDALQRALVAFLEDHEEKLTRRFQLKSLRPTVINLVHHLFDGDLMATLEVGQQQKARTVVDHYLSDGAKQLNDELLVPVYHGRDGWISSGGKVDPREGAKARMVDAASPGWECEDRYFNPNTERPSDIFCTEYGMCPNCKMGRARVGSPEAYAYAVKLREAIKRSRTTMHEHVWLAKWMPVMDVMDRKSLRSFEQQAIDAADLDIPPLPTVE